MLQATGKFRDSLTDRKRSLHLPPVLWRECTHGFDHPGLDRRLLQGGLPGVLLNPQPDPAFFEDWMDSFYARDIQELFGVRNRTGFMALLKLAGMPLCSQAIHLAQRKPDAGGLRHRAICARPYFAITAAASMMTSYL